MGARLSAVLLPGSRAARDPAAFFGADLLPESREAPVAANPAVSSAAVPSVAQTPVQDALDKPQAVTEEDLAWALLLRMAAAQAVGLLGRQELGRLALEASQLLERTPPSDKDLAVVLERVLAAKASGSPARRTATAEPAVSPVASRSSQACAEQARRHAQGEPAEDESTKAASIATHCIPLDSLSVAPDAEVAAASTQEDAAPHEIVEPMVPLITAASTTEEDAAAKPTTPAAAAARSAVSKEVLAGRGPELEAECYFVGTPEENDSLGRLTTPEESPECQAVAGQGVQVGRSWPPTPCSSKSASDRSLPGQELQETETASVASAPKVSSSASPAGGTVISLARCLELQDCGETSCSAETAPTSPSWAMSPRTAKARAADIYERYKSTLESACTAASLERRSSARLGADTGRCASDTSSIVSSGGLTTDSGTHVASDVGGTAQVASSIVAAAAASAAILHKYQAIIDASDKGLVSLSSCTTLRSPQCRHAVDAGSGGTTAGGLPCPPVLREGSGGTSDSGSMRISVN